MKLLAVQKQHQDIRTSAQTLKERGISVTGPHRGRNGALVFSVVDAVVTAEGLRRFQGGRKLSGVGIGELFAEIDKRAS